MADASVLGVLVPSRHRKGKECWSVADRNPRVGDRSWLVPTEGDFCVPSIASVEPLEVVALESSS